MTQPYSEPRFPRRQKFALPLLVSAVATLLVGCGDEPVTSSGQEQSRDYGVWTKVEVPGAVCGNGSQYKFFVNWSETSDDVAIVFEGGGACWDYDSCTGKTELGAANPDGIEDNHMGFWQIVFPFTRRDAENPARDWNLVYMPYCTGDIHSGNRDATYTGTAEEGSIEFHHAGHKNNVLIVDWLAAQFKHIPRLLVSGCSAGGAGTLSNYYFLRKGLPVDRGYMLDDSGPIFPSSGPSQYLHKKIREAWDVDSIYDEVPFELDKTDLGSINTALADEFPNDRLSITFFQRDYDYSRYSYERFYPGIDKPGIMSLWAEDTKLLTQQYDTRKNLAYFIPYWRERNNSHCGTVLDYVGTEIQEAGLDLGDFVDDLLDDEKPLKSYLESPQSGEDGTP